MAVLPIGTERLVLRVMQPGDAAALAAYRDDPEVARFQDWSLPFGLANAEGLLASQAHLDDLDPEGWTQVAIDHQGEMVGDLAVRAETSARAPRSNTRSHHRRSTAGSPRRRSRR